MLCLVMLPSLCLSYKIVPKPVSDRIVDILSRLRESRTKKILWTSSKEKTDPGFRASFGNDVAANAAVLLNSFARCSLRAHLSSCVKDGFLALPGEASPSTSSSWLSRHLCHRVDSQLVHSLHRYYLRVRLFCIEGSFQLYRHLRHSQLLCFNESE